MRVCTPAEVKANSANDRTGGGMCVDHGLPQKDSPPSPPAADDRVGPAPGPQLLHLAA